MTFNHLKTKKKHNSSAHSGESPQINKFPFLCLTRSYLPLPGTYPVWCILTPQATLPLRSTSLPKSLFYCPPPQPLPPPTRVTSPPFHSAPALALARGTQVAVYSTVCSASNTLASAPSHPSARALSQSTWQTMPRSHVRESKKGRRGGELHECSKFVSLIR